MFVPVIPTPVCDTAGKLLLGWKKPQELTQGGGAML